METDEQRQKEEPQAVEPEDEPEPEDDGPERLDLDPLDLAILGALPEEGTRIGKYLLDTRNVRQIARDLDDPHVTTTIIGRRFHDLRKFGYVIGRVRGTGSTNWQRTKLGTEAVGEPEKSENGQ